MKENEILDANFESVDSKIALESITRNNFIILHIATLSLYSFWWMYKAWNYYKEKEKLDIMPAARSFFALFFMISLFNKIRTDALDKGYTKNFSSVLLFFVFIIFNLLNNLPEPFMLISYLGFIAYLQPLAAYNFAIDQSPTHKLTVLEGFNKRQIGLLLVGGILWFLIVLGTFYTEEGF